MSLPEGLTTSRLMKAGNRFFPRIHQGRILSCLRQLLSHHLGQNNASDVASTSQSSIVASNGFYTGNQLRRRVAAESIPSHHMEMSMLQQVVPNQENVTQSRAAALQNVESTISELGGIFTQLATMVGQQGELAIRIDDNIDETLANVEGARSALLKNLVRISSN